VGATLTAGSAGDESDFSFEPTRHLDLLHSPSHPASGTKNLFQNSG
jgi:hypothetical protein